MNVVNDSAIPWRRAMMAIAAVFICSIIAFGQYDKKPYLEWSENEANKIMNDSPWSQTHTLHRHIKSVQYVQR